MRNFLRVMALGAVLLVTAQVVLAAEPAPDKPNIILVMCDDLGYGDVGFNGNTIIRTPHLDEMAKAGIRFTRFYSGGPVCSPTRGTCLTGRHYLRYGILGANSAHLPAQEMTIAKMLKSQGYTTGHFGKWHLGTLSKTHSSKGPGRNPARNYAPPWERDYDESFATESRVPTWDPASDGFGESTPYYHNGRIATDNLEGDDSRVIMDRVVPFLRKAREAEQPFLAVIWFHTPHGPVVAGPQYRAMYAQYSEGEQHYYGCITAMDEQVGRLRKELRRLGASDRTMIWFCSDNGPEGLNGKERRYRGSTGGLRGRKRSLFCGGVCGPALLEWPGRAGPARVVDVPCSTLDYFPTIKELIGFEMPDKRPLDGISLLPLIDGHLSKRPVPIPFFFFESKRAMFGSPTIAMVGNRYKLLTNLSEDGREDLLFDLVEDRAEKNNIIAEHPDAAAAIKTSLRKWIESCKTSHSGADYDGPFTPVSRFPTLTGSWREKKTK